MRRRIAPATTTLVAVLITVLGVLSPTAPPAGAAGLSAIGVTGLAFGRDVAVDPGTGRLFVSGDDKVLVRTPAGAALKTIPGIPGALDVHVAGGQVYVVSATAARIVRIDPVSMTITKTYQLPTTPLLVGLTTYDGRLWTVAQSGPNEQTLVSIPLGAGNPVLWSDIEIDGPVVGLVGSGSHLVVGVWEGIAALELNDEGDTLTVVGQTDPEEPDDVAHLALGADGTSVVAGYRSGGGVRELSLPTLALVTEHPTGTNVGSVAATPLGGGLIASVGSEIGEYGYAPDTFLFRPGPPDQVGRAQANKGDTRKVVVGALAWSADGSTLWALRDDGPYQSPLVPALVPLSIVPSGVTAFPSTVAPAGASTTVTGTGFTGGTVAVDGTPATITTFRPDRLVVDLPALDTGPTAIAVTGLTGAFAGTNLTVRDLGPFTSSLHLTEEIEDGFFPGIGVNLAWAQWEDIRLAGGSSIGALAVDIARSHDWVRYRDLAARLYLATFDRPADPEGLRYWWGQLSSRSLVSVAAFFARSSEFQETYGALDDEEFVARIYQNVLDRDPDAAGAAYWEGRLAAGLSRGAVLAHFSESPEHKTASKPEVETTFLYVALLQRSPTAEELSTGSQQAAQSLVVLAEDILESPEYAALIA